MSPRRAAQVHQPAAGGQHPGRGRRRRAEHRVDHHVDVPAAGGAEPLGQRRDVVGELDDRVGAGRGGALGRPAGPAHRDHPRRPSSRAAPTATWPTAPPAPRTTTRSPACSRARQVSAIQRRPPRGRAPPLRRPAGRGEGHQVGVGDPAPLGQAAVARRHPGRGREPDPGTGRVDGGVGHHSHALHTGHVAAPPAGRSRRCPRRTAGPAARPGRRSPAPASARAPAPGPGGPPRTARSPAPARTAALHGSAARGEHTTSITPPP